MAKKIEEATASRLKALGIKAKSEEEARKGLLKILAENDIDGMEEEDTGSLLDMAESMVDVETPEEHEEDDEEREADELAEEVDDEEEEDDEEDDEEDEPEKEEPAKKPAKKSEKKPEKKSEKKAVEPKKEKKAAEKKPGKRGIKLDPKNNKDDRKEFKFLEKFFPTDKYDYCWIATNGVTIKYKGSNSSRAVVTLEMCSKRAEGEIVCNLYLLTFTKSLEVLDKENIEYQTCWSGAPFLHSATFKEVKETLEALLSHIEDFVLKIDKRLGDNRKKMEESLKKTTKKEKSLKKTSEKVEEPEETEEPEEEEEVDDVEDKKPAKKSAKKPAAKKSKK